MKVVRNDNNNPLNPAEMNACQQFEASTQAGQVLFRPQVGRRPARAELRRPL